MQTPHPGGCARRPRRFVLSPLRTIPNLGLQDEGRFPPPPRVPPPTRSRCPPPSRPLFPAPSPERSPQRGRGGAGRTLQGRGTLHAPLPSPAEEPAPPDKLPRTGCLRSHNGYLF